MLGVSFPCATSAARPPHRPSCCPLPPITTPPLPTRYYHTSLCTTFLAHPSIEKCRLPNSSHRCVIEGGQLLGVLTRLDLVENAKGMMRPPWEAAGQMKTLACLGISRGNLLESNSSSRRSSTGSAASCDAKTELL